MNISHTPAPAEAQQGEQPRTILKITIRRGRKTLHTLRRRTAALRATASRTGRRTRGRLRRSGWLDTTRMNGAILAGLISAALYALFAEASRYLLG